MSEKLKPCEAFLRDQLLCSNGFRQRALCWGAIQRCSCGTVQGAPDCLNDDYAPPHMIDERGLPRHRTLTPEQRND